jgi:hypothetical protein
MVRFVFWRAYSATAQAGFGRRQVETPVTNDLVTVFRTGDAVDLAIAKAALDAEQIRYVVEGELIQDLIGLGRYPAGFNAVTGPIRIRVTAENAARALEALVGIGDES